MQKRKLGTGGPEISLVGLGTNNFGGRIGPYASQQVIDKALLEEYATRRGHTLLDLAVSWLASRPFVSSIIAGATTPEQIVQNVTALGWALTPADLVEIDRITL